MVLQTSASRSLSLGDDLKNNEWVYVYHSLFVFQLFAGPGCWFGDKQANNPEFKVWIPNVTKILLKGVHCQLRLKYLCRKLVELLFDEEELQSVNLTEARTAGVALLDANTLYAIRG